MSTHLPKIIAIVGPTATGKTRLAIQLARKFNGEIVSADSRQLYKGMDIGTGKPTRQEQRLVRHHLLDVVRPNQAFNVTHYKKAAQRSIRGILKRDKLPLLVGGTGFFVQSIVDNVEFPEVEPNERLRRKLAKYPTSKLYKILESLDSRRAKTIDKNNPRRLIRAIEVAKALKKVPNITKGSARYDVLLIGISLPKAQLDRNIARRVDSMMRRGLVREVKTLRKTYNANLPAMSGIGYKEIGMYLQGKLSLQDAVAHIRRNTRNYAKRQMTWFKRDSRVHWIQNNQKTSTLVKKFLRT